MKPNARRSALAAIALAAVIGAYLLGKGAGQREAQAAARASENERARATASALSTIGAGSGKAGEVGDSESAAGGAGAGQPSVKSIIAKARSKMTGGVMNISGMMRALSVLDAIGDDQIMEALAEIERSVKEPQQKVLFGMLLLGRWAESDGPAALAYAEENYDTKNPMMMGLRSSVLSTWAQNDPEGTWKWYLNQEEDGTSGPFGSSRRMALSGIIGSLAMKDVDLAFARIAEIEGEQDRQSAMQGLGQAVWDDSRRAEMLDKIQSFEDEDEKTQMLDNVVRQWTQFDPEGAIEWAATLEDESQRAAVVEEIAQGLRWTNPQRAGELLLAEAQTADQRSEAYSQAVSNWARNDPNGAGKWLGQQEQGPELDAAREQFATSVMGKDPESAMAWADAVTDEEARARTVESVYEHWREKDQQAADAALEGTGLSQDKIEALKNLKTAVPLESPAE